MSLIIPTLEETMQMKRERMEIIDSVMKIKDPKSLHILAVVANKYYVDCIRELPLTLNEFIDMLDLPMIIRLSDLFEGEDSHYLANMQIKELLCTAMERYADVSEEENNNIV